MLDQNESKLTVTPARKKMPLDARIVGWLFFITALISFFLVGLLLIGVAHSPSDYHRPVLFGTFSLTSDLSLGIHTFLMGMVSLVSAYGLIRGYKLGWWIELIFSIVSISDSMLIFSDHPVATTTGICISIGIIIWLICRKRLYNIGRNPETGK